MPIATTETEFAAPPNIEGADPARPSTWWPAIATDSLRKAQPWRIVPHLPTETTDVEILAYVNHGRWVVDCLYCSSAQNCTPADPRFWCPTCGSQGAWHKIVFPRDRDRIEQILDRRPDARNRNWFPRETVEDLIRENHDNGID